MTPVLDAVRREELRTTIVTALYGSPIERPESTEELLAALIDIARRPALLAYIAELEAGLKPFAKAADRADHNARLFDMTMAASEEMSPGLGIKFSHLRAARAALLPKASVREERG